MPSSWSRRRFLQGSTATALALGAVSTASFPSAAASEEDEFAALPAKWRDLILGTDFDPASELFRTQLATLGSTAAGRLAAMAPATGSLWPDLVWTDPEPDTDARIGHGLKLTFGDLTGAAGATHNVRVRLG